MRRRLAGMLSCRRQKKAPLLIRSACARSALRPACRDINGGRRDVVRLCHWQQLSPLACRRNACSSACRSCSKSHCGSGTRMMGEAIQAEPMAAWRNGEVCRQDNVQSDGYPGLNTLYCIHEVRIWMAPPRVGPRQAWIMPSPWK